MAKKIPYDQFEEYLNGSLTEVELQAFEVQLKTDDGLKKELDLYQEIKKAQKNKGLTDFESKLKLAEKEYFNQPEPVVKKLPSRRLWMLAAAVFIGSLILAGLKIFGFIGKPPSSDQLYAQFAKHEFSFQEMSNNTSLGEMQNLLENKEYATVLPLLNNYLKEHPNDADVKLAHAIALLETNQYETALASFLKLGTDHPLYKNESIWYQALTYLKQNQLTKSISSLRQIPNDSSRFTESQQLTSILEKRLK